jgi:TatD DNase family protein
VDEHGDDEGINEKFSITPGCAGSNHAAGGSLVFIMMDTHAHVHGREFDEDRGPMLARAREAGVETIVTVGCDLDDSRLALETAETFGLLATIGIHPHEAKDAPADIAAAFDELRTIGGARVVAIGETGLDFHYNHSPVADQHRVLIAQLAYARACGLPVVFHQREAMDDFLAIMREHFDPGTMSGVIHCFTGNAAEAATFVEEFGLKLGIGGVVTFKTAEPLRAAIRTVGIDALILETDCPYLAPIPFRGKRNEPAFITKTLERVAEVLGRETAEVASITDRNARALFAREV